MIENKLICELICDQYGNYVVQKALQVTDGLKFMAIIHVRKKLIKIILKFFKWIGNKSIT